jgi:4-carboxymuconolactone decarboxylase
VRAAVSLGVTRGEIIEILMQTAVYAGFPAALNALSDCHDLLTDDDCLGRSCG